MGFLNFKGFKLTPEGRRLERVLKELDSLEVAVGYTAESGSYDDSDNPPTLVEVAAVNEFGTDRIPSRPFIRGTYLDHTDEVENFIKRSVATGIRRKEEPNAIMSRIGVYAKGLMQKEIVEGAWAPNAPLTIKRKHSDKPLIDTGRMRQSIVYVVRKKGSGPNGT